MRQGNRLRIQKTSRIDRISHVDLLNLWRGDMQALHTDIDKRFSEMRWLVGIGFAVIALLIAIATFVR